MTTKPMTRDDLAASIADEMPGISKHTIDAVLRKAERRIGLAVASGTDVRLRSFGTFSLWVTPPRDGRNPATGEKIRIGETRTVKFAAGRALKDALLIHGTPTAVAQAAE